MRLAFELSNLECQARIMGEMARLIIEGQSYTTELTRHFSVQ